MRNTSVVKKKPAPGQRQMGAGEFKAKCLRVMDEVQESGQPVIVTKRGKPVGKFVPITEGIKKDDFLGRLEGIIQINGDPDDLVKPIFPIEDWDMLR